MSNGLFEVFMLLVHCYYIVMYSQPFFCQVQPRYSYKKILIVKSVGRLGNFSFKYIWLSCHGLHIFSHFDLCQFLKCRGVVVNSKTLDTGAKAN